MGGPGKRNEEQPVLDAETVEDLELADADGGVLGGAAPSLRVGYC